MGHSVDATTSVVERLTRAQRYAAQGLSRLLAEDGCTLDQWRVLRVLADGEGHLMGEVAAELLLAQPTLTRVVDGLVDRAQVYRRASDADGRKVSVHLSRQGRTRLARLDAIAAAHETALRDDPRWRELSAGL
ncbi:MarR family winged helix-turn-helix transcriptional regulator [Nocardioides panacis]|uniref:MarR family winged helix-turn-helix transcriptional regulator n=1 Tax=Nocardioides panacis TaxID=2849501 RepID=A0A975Y188_9ACTN|nr:MarR family winged helix-turn-helix transcriptional regulator [Nocardioides panacis]QWZ09261.1 MarR family winged helix-turn-helix transcriptional regulator [Nocardioides panacis]